MNTFKQLWKYLTTEQTRIKVIEYCVDGVVVEVNHYAQHRIPLFNGRDWFFLDVTKDTSLGAAQKIIDAHLAEQAKVKEVKTTYIKYP
jgi:hypothetical protein